MQVNFDLERMKEAIASPRIQLPEGLSRAQRRDWVREKLKELKR